MRSSSPIEKIGFVLSLAILTLCYGVAAGHYGWVPSSVLTRAFDQARVAYQSWTSSDLGFPLRTHAFEHSGVRSPSPGRIQPGATLITSSWKNRDGWNVGLMLISQKGKRLHKWFVDRSELFQAGAFQRGTPNQTDIHGSYLLSNGDVLVNLGYVGLARLDACGEVLWTLEEGNHHSIAQAEDGSFWVPGVASAPRAESTRYPDGFPGLGGKSVWIDRILRVSKEGEVLESTNVLDILYANGLERYIPKTLGGTRPTPQTIPADLTHLNDVEPLAPSSADEYPLFEAGDLLVSLRHLSLVFVFDPDSNEVKWHSADPFIYQHDPDFIGNGWIGVFDNNYDLTEQGDMLGGNRIVALQPHTDSVEVLFPTDHSDTVYTDVLGKWQSLENGNMLLVEGKKGRVVEVASDGRTVWEWIHAPTDNSRVPPVTKASRHDLTLDQIASWPCSSIASTDAAQ